MPEGLLPEGLLPEGLLPEDRWSQFIPRVASPPNHLQQLAVAQTAKNFGHVSRVLSGEATQPHVVDVAFVTRQHQRQLLRFRPFLTECPQPRTVVVGD